MGFMSVSRGRSDSFSAAARRRSRSRQPDPLASESDRVLERLDQLDQRMDSIQTSLSSLSKAMTDHLSALRERLHSPLPELNMLEVDGSMGFMSTSQGRSASFSAAASRRLHQPDPSATKYHHILERLDQLEERLTRCMDFMDYFDIQLSYFSELKTDHSATLSECLGSHPPK